MPDSPIIMPRERWYDRLIIHSSDADERAELANLVAYGIPDYHGIHDVELAKRTEEIALIVETTNALNIFRAMVNLDPISFHLNRCHVLHPDDWAERIAPSSPGALAQSLFGHCYIPRQDHPVEFAKLLTHEITHANSYLAIEISPSPNGRPKLKLRRTGFAFLPGDAERVIFNGFNEGVTELMTHNLRAIISRQSQHLSAPDLADLTSSIRYYPQFRLVEGLMTHDGERTTDPRPLRQLMTDYLTGTWDFCRWLLPTWPKANRFLRDLDSEPRSALLVAEQLGLTRTQQAIHNVLAAQG